MRRPAPNPEELARFDVPSEPGNERLAMARVTAAVEGAGLTEDQLERLRTAVAEATMNGIEHGNDGRADVPVEVVVLRDEDAVVVTVTDLGGARQRGNAAESPDIEAKLAGLQRPRGWGLFLIEHMVDEVADTTEGDRHTVRLVIRHTEWSDGGGFDGRRR
ncbi:MAG TPA: ATP-binding protein [Acidimicrobiales bacterium]|nr:ATP-binding protein [Acidimicrobiales bacterium]